MSDEELLKEAVRRYPVGTEYLPAHLSFHTIEDKCTVDEKSFYWYGSYIIQSLGNREKNGHTFVEVVYDGYNKKWSTIISPEEK